MLQISPLEETTIFFVIFSFADVKTRSNFACINFGVRVDSCRQVKLFMIIWNYRLVCIFFLLLCSNKAAKSVAHVQTIHNQRASLGNRIILSSNDNKSARTNVDQRLP